MKALLFDLDGTLVDSVPLWINANLHVLKSVGFTITAEKFLTDIYHAGLHYEGMLEKLGLETTNAKKIYEDRDNLFIELLKKNAAWMGEAETILKHCAKHFPLGILTGSKRRFVDAMDTKLDFSSLFSAIVTRDDTGTNMKPNPYGLLLLAQRMGIAPIDCLYVGDQSVDVQAAKNAQMSSCLLLMRETPKGAEKGADFVIDRIEKLEKML